MRATAAPCSGKPQRATRHVGHGILCLTGDFATWHLDDDDLPTNRQHFCDRVRRRIEGG
jgi:hypothetical protein